MVFKMKKKNDIKYVKNMFFDFFTEYLKNVTKIFFKCLILYSEVFFTKNQKTI